MILDEQNLFSDAQAVTVQAVSTNSVDLGLAGQNIGVGEVLYLVVSVETALTNGGAGTTVDFELVNATNAALTAGLVVIQTMGSVISTAAAGTRVVVKLPPDGVTLRYLGVRYTPNGAALTGGAFDAFLTKDIAAFTAYADNITIT